MPDSNAEKEILKAALGQRSECLRVESFEAVTDGSLDAESSARVQEHLGACARCRNELAMFQEFQTAAPIAGQEANLNWVRLQLERPSGELFPSAAPATAVPVRSRRNLWRMVLVFTASLIVVVGISVRWQQPPEEQIGTGGPTVWRSRQISVLSPVGELNSAPANFKWEPVQAAATYQVRLMEVDRTQIWAGETAGIFIALPTDIQRRMTPGRTFFWEVIARNASGARIAASNLQRIHILITSR